MHEDDVRVEVAALRESLPAEGADEGPLARVDPVVFPDVPLLGGVSADAADVHAEAAGRAGPEAALHSLQALPTTSAGATAVLVVQRRGGSRSSIERSLFMGESGQQSLRINK